MTRIREADSIRLGQQRVDSVYAGRHLVWQRWLPSRGPDGALPLQQSDWASGRGWFANLGHESVAGYLAAASGSFLRGSGGACFNAAGILTGAGENELRLDHDPATGQALGYRAEGQRTNLWRTDPALETLFTGSMDIRGIPLRQFTGDGATVPNWSDGNGRWSGSDIPTASIIAKRGSERYLMLGLTGTTTSTNGNAAFDFDVGEYSYKGNTYSFDKQDLGDGLWRLSILSDHSGASAVLRGLRVRPSSGTSNQSHVIPDGETVAWGAPQVEISAAPPQRTFPSSPILTYGGEATRLADDLSFDMAAPVAGTVRIHARTAIGTERDQVLWQWDDGSEANRYRIMRDKDRDLHVIVTVASAPAVDLVLGAVANDADLAIAFAWEMGRFSASLNGGAVATNTNYTGALPAVCTLREGTDTNGRAWFGTIARMARYAAAYSDAQIAAMTG